MNPCIRILLAIAAMAPTAAWAQSQPGSSSETGTMITRRPAEVQGETKLAARLTLRQFGNCTVRRRPQVAEAVIDLPVDTPEFDRSIRRIASDECLAQGDLVMSTKLLRAAIFEALYLRRFGRDAHPNFQSAPTFNYAERYSRPLSPAAQTAVGLAIVADCVVRTAPVGAHELITSIPGSPLEDRAIAVMARQLPGCVPPKQTFRFSRSVIRGSVAEALYRLSTVTQDRKEAAK